MSSLARTLAAELPHATPGGQVRIEGWVHRRRALATVTFLIVRDRSGLAQVVVRDQPALEMVRACGEETVVSVTGTATPVIALATPAWTEALAGAERIGGAAASVTPSRKS